MDPIFHLSVAIFKINVKVKEKLKYETEESVQKTFTHVLLAGNPWFLSCVF